MPVIAVLTLIVVFAQAPAHTHVPERTSSVNVTSAVDQEKAASEFNHRVAGIVLVLIGGLVIVGQYSQRLSFLRYAWPLLFVAMGLFLAAWSDAEIWPRGPLSWTWLIDHDTEARQHKIYAVLLLCMAAVEFLRARGKLRSRFLQTWSFPLLALVGAALLGFHVHSGTSGLPQGWNANQPAPQAMTGDQQQHHDHAHGSTTLAAETATHDHDMHHAMTPEATRIQRQHFWMMLTGIAVAIFKILADGRFFQSRVVLYLWPTFTAILGSLLILYRE
jgi:hypothetical protein